MSISKNFLYLRGEIKKLIKDINFKKIARETNSSGINEDILGGNDVEINNEH